MDVVRILREAGANDDTVTESRGQALRESDPPVRAAFAWLEAIQREDLEAMKKGSTYKELNDVDFNL